MTNTEGTWSEGVQQVRRSFSPSVWISRAEKMCDCDFRMRRQPTSALLLTQISSTKRLPHASRPLRENKRVSPLQH